MRRREFITLLGGAAAAAGWPLAARAQPPGGIKKIAALLPFAEGDAEGRVALEAFRLRLQEHGWSEPRACS